MATTSAPSRGGDEVVPLLRGLLLWRLVAAPLLVVLAPTSAARTSAGTYGAALCASFAISAPWWDAAMAAAGRRSAESGQPPTRSRLDLRALTVSDPTGLTMILNADGKRTASGRRLVVGGSGARGLFRLTYNAPQHQPPPRQTRAASASTHRAAFR